MKIIMTMLKKLIQYLLKSFGNIAYAIIGAIAAACIVTPVLVLYAKNTLNYILQAIQSPTPLWVAIVLALVLGLCISYIYQQAKKPQTQNTSNKEKFIKLFGILWDKNYQPHCDTHKNLLQSYRRYATADPAISRWGFTCPDCKNLIIIADQNGNYITQEDAVKKIKAL